jgi:hypothetical protein
LHIGLLVRDWILHLAQLLVTDEAPGLVVLIFGILLFGLIAWALTRAISRIRAVRGLTAMVNMFKDGVEFSESFDRFNAGIQNWARGSSARQAIVDAWEEYAETTVIDSRDGQDLRRNSVRPSSFLNLEDLGFGPGVLRIAPGLFVSLGLLCTFLGLVAALNALGTDLNNGSKPEEVVIKLMTIASAKFVMSLAGLACSIIFSIVLRSSQGRLDSALHRLCHAIERRLSFVSLEDLGFRQLKAVEEQREAYRKIGMEFVEQLQRPLNELPGKISESISSSIATEMKPMFDKVSQMGSSGMENMVGDLSNQITSKVGLALEKTSTALTEAAEQISRMVDRMNTSSNQMGQGMETALGQMASAIADLRGQVAATGEVASTTMTEGADKLLGVMNDTLQGIRDNTAAGAEAMKAAAAEMRTAAEGFGKELAAATANGVTAVSQRIGAASDAADQAITSAGQEMLAAFGKTSAEIAKVGADMSAALGSEVVGHLNALGKQLEDLVRAVNEGVGGMRSASTSLKSGADTIAAASVSFGGASRELVSATDPVRVAHERIAASIRDLLLSTEATANGSKSMVESATQVLEAARSALGNEREGIRQTLDATRASLSQLSDEAEKLNDIDQLLGRALAQYAQQLDEALGTAQSHIRKMQDTLAPGIDTLRAVVERVEAFKPSPAGRTF